jgi:HK97 gp10 family phage protein
MELDVVGEEIKELALSLVPIRTGYLASTIFHEMLTEELVMRFGAKAEYAAYVEFGTRTMAARPFIRPALGDCWSKLQEAVRVALANAAR